MPGGTMPGGVIPIGAMPIGGMPTGATPIGAMPGSIMPGSAAGTAGTPATIMLPIRIIIDAGARRSSFPECAMKQILP